MSGAESAPRTRILLAFATIFLVWGSSYLASRLGVLALPPFLFAGSRFLLAGGLMLGFAALTRERIRLSRREWRDLAILALFGFVLANGINIWSLQFVASNVSALLNASVPCWIALLGSMGTRGQRPGVRVIVGLIIGIAGTALVMRPTAGAEQAGLWPQLLILLGCLCWSISTLYLRNMASSLSIATLIGWQMLLGGAVLMVLGFSVDEAARWNWASGGLWMWLYLIVFASCLAHTAYAWLARRVSPTSLGTYAYVNPMIATVLGWWLLHESLQPRQVLGMIVVLTGVLLINWPASAVTSLRRIFRW